MLETLLKGNCSKTLTRWYTAIVNWLYLYHHYYRAAWNADAV